MKHAGAVMLLLLFIFPACNKGPYSTTNKSYKKKVKALAKIIKQAPLTDSTGTYGTWVGTTNFNLRKPDFVIIHHTAQNSCDETLKTFTLPRTKVSAHYVICRNGTVQHLLNDYLRAWHGGTAKWGNAIDINSSSIGIEIDNNGTEPFSDAQIESLMRLLARLKAGFGIPTANFIGHSDIAPGRKVDPSVLFPWKKLADAGFGYWWSDTTGVKVPADFNSLQALRIIGYNIKDSASAIETFKRKYEQQDNSKTLNDADRKILFCLYRKFE